MDGGQCLASLKQFFEELCIPEPFSEKYAQRFIENSIDFETLPYLTEHYLEQMEITQIGHKIKIMKYIRSFDSENIKKSPPPAFPKFSRTCILKRKQVDYPQNVIPEKTLKVIMPKKKPDQISINAKPFIKSAVNFVPPTTQQSSSSPHPCLPSSQQSLLQQGSSTSQQGAFTSQLGASTSQQGASTSQQSSSSSLTGQSGPENTRKTSIRTRLGDRISENEEVVSSSDELNFLKPLTKRIFSRLGHSSTKSATTIENSNQSIDKKINEPIITRLISPMKLNSDPTSSNPLPGILKRRMSNPPIGSNKGTMKADEAATVPIQHRTIIKPQRNPRNSYPVGNVKNRLQIEQGVNSSSKKVSFGGVRARVYEKQIVADFYE